MTNAGYRATKTVSPAEGSLFGPGELIEGFDPDQPHNAALIEDGAVQVFDAPPEPEKPSKDALLERADELGIEGLNKRSTISEIETALAEHEQAGGDGDGETIDGDE